MKHRGFGLVLTASILVLTVLPCFAQWAPSPQHPQGFPQNAQCTPRQPISQPVGRSVSVKVPISCTPLTPSPYPCGEVRHRQSQTLPVRVEVAVRPETPCDRGRIPVAVRDPGPLQPIICSGAELMGAVVAAPFRLIEILCPFGQRQPCSAPAPRLTCPPPRPRAPLYGPAVSYHSGVVQGTPLNHPPVCQAPQHACPPPGPSISPLPPDGHPSPSLCFLPPRLVHEHQLPALEPRSLIGGLWNLPATFLTRVRWTGDLWKSTPHRSR